MRTAALSLLFVFTAFLAGSGEAASLAASICLLQQDPQKTVQCLRESYDKAVAELHEQEEQAEGRLREGPDLHVAFDRAQNDWALALARECKTLGGYTDQTDWACLIDKTHERTRELEQIGR